MVPEYELYKNDAAQEHCKKILIILFNNVFSPNQFLLMVLCTYRNNVEVMHRSMIEDTQDTIHPNKLGTGKEHVAFALGKYLSH
jgi:hypothetical protein